MATLFMYFLLFIALSLLTNHFLHKIKNLPPSPFPTLPLIGHLYLLKKPLHRTLSKLSARWGPILYLRLGARPVLLISSPSAVEECLTKNDIVFANRPRLIAGKHLGYNYTTLAWASYSDHWRNLRKISSLEILSSHRIRMLSGIRSDEVQSMIRGVYNRVNNSDGVVVEMKSVLFELTLNIMMRMIAGKRYYGENVAELEEARRFRDIVFETFELGDTSNVGDFLPVLRWLFGIGGSTEKKLMALQVKRDGFMQSLIEESRKRDIGCSDGVRKQTMIEVLLELQEKEPEYYKDEIIRGLMLVLFSAGTDTSAGTMEWALSLLLNHPKILKKAQIEIDTHVGHDRLIEESDLPKLPYLHSIIIETLRMYPAGPLLPHESSEECIVGCYRIPRGTMLLVNLWAVQNDPKVWEEATKFKPERFEGVEGGRDGFKLMPFGSGRRGCPGENLGIRMVGLALGSLIQFFEWERIGEEMVDMTEGAGLTLPKAQPLLAKCWPRPTMLNLLSQISSNQL